MPEDTKIREQWLMWAVERLRPDFEKFADFTLPQVLRVSTGFPSTRALSKNNKRVGEHWPSKSSKDGSHQIFISPVLSDTEEVLGTLVHEMLHAALPDKAGHGKLFKKGMKLVGLEGKAKSTEVGSELRERLNALSVEIGPYPHVELVPTERERKQGTRLIKLTCPKNKAHAEDLIIRTTRKVLDFGPPQCWCGSEYKENA